MKERTFKVEKVAKPKNGLQMIFGESNRVKLLHIKLNFIKDHIDQLTLIVIIKSQGFKIGRSSMLSQLFNKSIISTY